MLELFDQNPQSRVFHVDRECYIVYLGSHWEDYKPFLRLGTSADLPSGLAPIISTIVVPDAMTGNPLDEPACLAGDATPETHYVGDVETVEHMKSFVGQQTIPVEAIEAVDHEEDDGRHVLVYYYKDGNLKIKFRKNEVFDLRRREKLDGHFVARANDAKNEYGRSPFKLPGDVYQEHGFIVAAGTPYLVARGELAALRLAPDYFFDLSAAGVDADRISIVQTDDADASLIRFFKRSRTRNRAVRISSARGSRVDEAAQLFPENSLPALKAKVAEGHGGAFEFHRYHVALAPGRMEAAIDGLDGPVVFVSGAKKRAEGAVVVDAGSGTVSLAKGGTHPLVQGALYRLGSERLTRTSIEEQFLPEKNYQYRDLLSTGENALIGQFQYFVNELFGGRDVAKVVKTIKGLDPVRSIGKADGAIHPVMQVVLHNYKQYFAYVHANEFEAARGCDAIEPILDKHQIVSSELPAMLPLVGEIVRDGDHDYLFYRFAARITSDRYAHAERVVEKINATPIIDYAAERARLADLVAGLATPEQMDEARMRRIAEARKKETPASKPAEKPKADVAPDEEGQPAASGARSGAAAARGRKGAPSRSRRSRSGASWIVPVAAVLVVIIALLALLYTGIIPNSWFASGQAIAANDPDHGQTTGPGSATGPGSNGADTQGGGTDAGLPGDGTNPEVGDTGPSGGTTSGEGPTINGNTGNEHGPQDGAGTSPNAQAEGNGASTGTNGTDTSTPNPNVDQSSGPNGDTAPGPTLPTGWPAEALPAIRALAETPGVTITRTRVIGPGGIEITLRDIIVLVNRIATDNGYARMDAIASSMPDPDWIYPGNVFVLPDASRYTVVQGDTLWEITVRYMVARLQQDYDQYTQLVAEYAAADTSDSRKHQIAETLRAIGEDSHTENFSRLVSQTLTRWGE